MTIKGSVDQIDTKGATGWIYNTVEQRPLVVEAVLHHRIIGETTADVFRHDLADVGMGDGRCGFSIEFPFTVDAAYLPFVAMRPAGGDVELPRTSLSGFGDFLRTLYASLPTTGRHRSVFGGLWTDRIDALAMLAGKRAIGTFSRVVETIIEHFIVHGHVTIDLHPDVATNDPETADFGKTERLVAAMVFQPLVDEVLKFILDDQAIVISGQLRHDGQHRFAQACTGLSLSSPIECLALLSPCGSTPVVIEMVRDSHLFPDFTKTGEARWLMHPDAAGLEHAVAVGSPVETLELSRHQVLILAAGKIFRCPQSSVGGIATAICVPSRQSPIRVGNRGHRKTHREFVSAIALTGGD